MFLYAVVHFYMLLYAAIHFHTILCPSTLIKGLTKNQRCKTNPAMNGQNLNNTFCSRSVSRDHILSLECSCPYTIQMYRLLCLRGGRSLHFLPSTIIFPRIRIDSIKDMAGLVRPKNIGDPLIIFAPFHEILPITTLLIHIVFRFRDNVWFIAF